MMTPRVREGKNKQKTVHKDGEDSKEKDPDDSKDGKDELGELVGQTLTLVEGSDNDKRPRRRGSVRASVRKSMSKGGGRKSIRCRKSVVPSGKRKGQKNGRKSKIKKDGRKRR